MRRLLCLACLPALLATLMACSSLDVAGARGDASPVCAWAPWVGLEKTLAGMEVDASLIAHEPTLRVVAYNIHSGLGQESKAAWVARDIVQGHLDGIADVIAAAASAPVDIVALNEVDSFARRSGWLDQAQYLADALERRTGARYRVIQGQTRERRFPGFEGGYGNAALVRHGISQSKACLYDDMRPCGMADPTQVMPELRASDLLSRITREKRGLIKLTLDFHGRALDVIVTHLEAVTVREREAQAIHLLRRFVDPARTTIILGDVNTVPTMMTQARVFATRDRTHDVLTSGLLADARVLYDARARRTDFRAWATYPADAPVWPLDMVLGSLDLVPHEVRILDSLASDHLGVYVAYRVASNESVISAQRALHDAIRHRQVARILECDAGAARGAKLRWLHEWTQFPALSAEEASASPRALSEH